MQCPGAGEEESLGRLQMGVPVLVLDDDRARVSACLGKRQCGRAESAFGANSTDQPVRSPAPRAMVHFMLAINGVISSLIRFPSIAGGDGRHGVTFPFVGGGNERTVRGVAASYRG